MAARYWLNHPAASAVVAVFLALKQAHNGA
jgi:hypothetical protein